MVIWIVIFFIILIISFFLALKSMADYQELPTSSTNSQYSLFLIRQPQALTLDILNKLYAGSLKNNYVLSFERLFKGEKKATVVFGPAALLQSFTQELGLLELEDYSKKEGGEMVAWEMGAKNLGGNLTSSENLIIQIPGLHETEEFWWQLVLQPSKNGLLGNIKGLGGLTGQKAAKTEGEFTLRGTIRAVLRADDRQRSQSLQPDLTKIGHNLGLALLPQAFSSPQIVKFYQERALPQTHLAATKRPILVLNINNLRALLDLG